MANRYRPLFLVFNRNERLESITRNLPKNIICSDFIELELPPIAKPYYILNKKLKYHNIYKLLVTLVRYEKGCMGK